LDNREFARDDPRGFLAQYAAGAIIDEIQHVPALLNYLQGEVDTRPDPGRFVLTGSQHFGLSQSISQSLAGRCGILVLLPLGLEELRAFPNAPSDLFSVLWQGTYPRIYDRNIPAGQWLADYTTTYIQRDVHQVLKVGDLGVFSGFLKLCAGRTAQEINLSVLGGDAGVSHNTARAWLSVLEASYIVHRLPAWHTNIRKQVAKAPKLHFFDSGLVCYLLGIREPEQLRLHPLRGAIFESWVIAEIYKTHVCSGIQPRLFHYREARGLKIDLLIEQGLQLKAVEIKSGATTSPDFFKNLERFSKRPAGTDPSLGIESHLVYGGDESRQRTGTKLISWRDVPRIDLGR
jgi:predicted AAA+ superfamily ATPase